MRFSSFYGPCSWLLAFAAFPPQSLADNPSSPPPIRVNVQASFPSPPYLVELIETFVDESPTAYLPLLNRVAEGYFDTSWTDQQLYHNFQKLIQDDDLISDLDSLSSFKFALAIRNTAPRIEAHYQYYKTAVTPLLHDKSCDAWIELQGKQYCDPFTEHASHASSWSLLPSKDLSFDRIIGNASDSNSTPDILTLYADITSPSFARFHWFASHNARNGKSPYRLRHKPPSPSPEHKVIPLPVSGYGVELALKRTDYIVIDDRPKSEPVNSLQKDQPPAIVLDPDSRPLDDLTPLSTKDLKYLGIQAATFVAESSSPLDSLMKLTKDFPKYSAILAARNHSEDFLKEHLENREKALAPGTNMLWINGVPYNSRKFDPFSLLHHLRRERTLISSFRDMRLTSPEAISLLSHNAFIEASRQFSAQRYDWRDDNEGGRVIIWLNDLEKDKRYRDWPSDVYSFLQRTFPGQLPSVRRNVFHAVIPVDLTRPSDMKLLVDIIQPFIKQKMAVRWGIVPISNTPTAAMMAKYVFHLEQSYGLAVIFEFLNIINTSNSAPGLAFNTVIQNRNSKNSKPILTAAEILIDDYLAARVVISSQYLRRLGIASASSSSALVNGIPIKLGADPLMAMLSQQVYTDLRIIQQAVFDGKITNGDSVSDLFLSRASLSHRPLINPSNDHLAKIINLSAALGDNADSVPNLPSIKRSKVFELDKASVIITVGDFDSTTGLNLAAEAARFVQTEDNIELLLIHNPKPEASSQKHMQMLRNYLAVKDSHPEPDYYAQSFDNLASQIDDNQVPTIAVPSHVWPNMTQFVQKLDLKPGENCVLFNGRLIGPIPHGEIVSTQDLNMLVKYENQRRNNAATDALADVGITERFSTALDVAKLRSLIALAHISDLPEDEAPVVRSNLFQQWGDKYTAFSLGENSTAAIQITASLDPASEIAQKWTPIFDALSKLNGVYMKIYLNPQTTLQELPVKRFYRYVLEHDASFTADGSVRGGAAEFSGIPSKALLNMGMDTPAAWLVSSKKSVHDLDNIRISSLESSDRVEATYQLESILIEGHSRDVSNDNKPPSGAQLLLVNDQKAQVADTIIMANLGYFQFKADPGQYSINLKPGPSHDIYNIDSLGIAGHSPQSGVATTHVALTSFQGLTLFPRFSRKIGRENDQVLDFVKPTEVGNLVAQGVNLVGSWLEKAGLKQVKTLDKSRTKHADINIFSVASGHLYERMLNIMMVSVMRHTSHRVKFWFIEQFLSPSFKKFVPILAKEYGFQYEMVTYKWPHWLHAQKEKQREIWGYKILFLDVLFPLDLDKVIFVDADQIVRTDMMKLINEELRGGAPYGFTPMCDSRTEMEGFRFWKQGYWKNYLMGLPYHISALYVVDLQRFRRLAAGDRLRQQYHQLSADPNSLSNLDQDLPNYMQRSIPIHSLDQNWLWCETWCSDEALKDARTIDLCNNPQTKEPKLARARRQIPEWTVYDDEIADLAKRTKVGGASIPMGQVQEADLFEAGAVPEHDTAPKPAESIKDEL